MSRNVRIAALLIGACGLIQCEISLGRSNGDKKPDTLAQTPTKPLILGEPGKLVGMMSFSADGSRLAYALMPYPGDKEGVVIVLDRKTSKEIQRINVATHGGALSPDGNTLALLKGDSTEHSSLALWDVASGNKIRDCEVPGLARWVGIVFHPDGKKLVGSPPAGAVCIWDTATGKIIQKVAESHGAVGTFAVSADGKSILTGQTSLRWEPFDPKVHKGQTVMKGKVSVVDWSYCLWNLDTGKESVLATNKEPLPDPWIQRIWRVHGFRAHISAGGTVFITPPTQLEARLEVGTSTKGKPTVWISDYLTGEKLLEIDFPLNAPIAIAGIQNGRTLVAATLDRDSFERKGTRVILRDVSELLEKETARVGKLSSEGLEKIWLDLANASDRKAQIAMFSLTLLPKKDFIAFFKKKIPTIKLADPERVARLLDDLDSEKFAVRQKAQAELETLGKEFLPMIEAGLKAKPTLEMKMRLEQILKKVQILPISGETVRGLRVLDIVEQYLGAEKRGLLELLANGPASAWVTEEAKASLGRLGEGK